jgi:hypothetical protein
MDVPSYLSSLSIILRHETSIDSILATIEEYPAMLQQRDGYGNPLHVECGFLCRSAVIRKCVELCPELLAMADREGSLPLHRLLENRRSSIEDALTMIERYPAAIQHPNSKGVLPLHIECKRQSRSTIIKRCIDLHPEALSIADEEGSLPLHILLESKSSSTEDALMMIERYPAALQHLTTADLQPLHIECNCQCRSTIVKKCIELYPEGLVKADADGYLPLHRLLEDESSSTEDALLMIKRYPTTAQHQNSCDQLPLHIECYQQCRSSVIWKLIGLYPEAASIADSLERLPLHYLIQNQSSSMDDVIRMIMQYPAALQRRTKYEDLPLYIECNHQCRAKILSKCIELYPEALNDSFISFFLNEVGRKSFSSFASVILLVFSSCPMSLYNLTSKSYVKDDIRDDPSYRRRILNLLPRHVFTPTHEADSRDLNWQPRYAMMMLLSQIQQQLSRRSDDDPMILVENLSENLNGWKDFLIRCIKRSSLMTPHVHFTVSQGICQHEDTGDMLLRSIVAFL